jgi:hypothetical protein
MLRSKHIGVRSFGTAVLTGKSDAVRTLVTVFAVPFPPVTAFVAHLAVPTVAVLDDHLPAKRVPVHLATFPAHVIGEELPEGDRFASARQFVLFCQFFFREGLVGLDVLDGADGQGLYVHVVQRIAAIGAVAVFVTGFVVFEAGTTSVLTAGLAIAVCLFFHCVRLLLRVYRRPWWLSGAAGHRVCG